jgi:hypothetical protein
VDVEAHVCQASEEALRLDPSPRKNGRIPAQKTPDGEFIGAPGSIVHQDLYVLFGLLD